MKYQPCEIVLCEMARHLVRPKYSVIHSLLDMTRLKMKTRISRVVKDVMQCAKRLETSIETHEVLMIRIYFPSTSNPPIYNHIQYATSKAKGQILQLSQEKNMQDC